jgi:hypothetical protein
MVALAALAGEELYLDARTGRVGTASVHTVRDLDDGLVILSDSDAAHPVSEQVTDLAIGERYQMAIDAGTNEILGAHPAHPARTMERALEREVRLEELL